MLSGDDELLATWSSMAPCAPPSRPLRAGCADGLRPVLTAAVRDADHDIGRGGETVPGRTKKLPSGRGEVIAGSGANNQYEQTILATQCRFRLEALRSRLQVQLDLERRDVAV